MIKVNRGSVEIAGTAQTISAETAGLIRHVFTSIAEHDKIAAAAAFNVTGRAMAEAAEDLVENYGLDLDMLNIQDEDEDEPEEFDSSDEDMMREFLDTLSPKELKSLLEIVEKFDEYADEEDD